MSPSSRRARTALGLGASLVGIALVIGALRSDRLARRGVPDAARGTVAEAAAVRGGAAAFDYTLQNSTAGEDDRKELPAFNQEATTARAAESSTDDYGGDDSAAYDGDLEMSNHWERRTGRPIGDGAYPFKV